MEAGATDTASPIVVTAHLALRDHTANLEVSLFGKSLKPKFWNSVINIHFCFCLKQLSRFCFSLCTNLGALYEDLSQRRHLLHNYLWSFILSLPAGLWRIVLRSVFLCASRGKGFLTKKIVSSSGATVDSMDENDIPIPPCTDAINSLCLFKTQRWIIHGETEAEEPSILFVPGVICSFPRDHGGRNHFTQTCQNRTAFCVHSFISLFFSFRTWCIHILWLSMGKWGSV